MHTNKSTSNLFDRLAAILLLGVLLGIALPGYGMPRTHEALTSFAKTQVLTGTLTTRLNPPVNIPTDTPTRFGWSVAANNDRVLIGAPGATVNGNGNQGLAFLYRWDAAASSWLLEATLAASNGAANDNFGYAVAMSKGTILIGTPGADVAGIANRGTVYVFNPHPATGVWEETDRILAPTVVAGAELGRALAISGNVAVAGAPLQNVGAKSNQGAALVIEYDTLSGQWAPTTELFASNGASGDAFGGALAISPDGNRVLIGAATLDTDGAMDHGGAYLFSRDVAGVWNETEKPLSPDGLAGEYCGSSVVLSDSEAVIGCPGRTSALGTVHEGAAFVFAPASGDPDVWEVTQTLVTSDEALNAFFGQALALSVSPSDSETYLLVGAPGLGRFYRGPLLAQNLSAWGADVEAGAFAGRSLAVSDKVLAVAAPYADQVEAPNSSQRGAVFVQRADLALTMPIAPSSATPIGSELVYQLAVTNPGNDTFTGVISVTDTLPPGALLISASGAYWNCVTVQNLLGCTETATLQPGATSYPITVRLLAPGTPQANLTNSVVLNVRGLLSDADLSNNTATSSIEVIDAAEATDLSTQLQDSADPAPIGSPLNYTITVSNLGNIDSQEVTVIDTLPAGSVFAYGSGTGWLCSAGGDQVTCTHAGIRAGDTAPLLTISTFAPGVAGTYQNSAAVIAGADPEPGNNLAQETTVVSSVAAAANLNLLDITPAQNPVTVNSAVSFNVMVGNAGLIDETGLVTVNIAPSPGLTITGASGNGWSCDNTGTCARTGLAAGVTAPIEVQATAPSAPGSASLTGSVLIAADTDPSGNVFTAWVDVIAAPNQTPLAVDDSATATKNTLLTLANVLANDNLGNLPAKITGYDHTSTQGGTVSYNNINFTYMPALEFTGDDSFTYMITDADGESSTGTVFIAVTNGPANTSPVAGNDSYTAFAGHLLSIGTPGVLGNDTDAEHNTLTAELVSSPASGTLVFNANGSFSYAPAADFTGSVMFTYRVSDGTLLSNTATVAIMVAPVGGSTAPAAADDTFIALTGQTFVIAAPGVLGNDTDAENNPVLAELVSPPAGGTLAFSDDGSFSYTPAADFTGPVIFTYRASDGTSFSNIATVTIMVQPAGSGTAPVATDDVFTILAGHTLLISAPGVLANDTDGENDALVAELVSAPASGTVAFGADGSFSYTPVANFFMGTDTFTYRINDGASVSDTATVTISVVPTGSGAAPSAANDTFTVIPGQTLSVSTPGVLINDADAEGDLLIADLVSTVSNGSLAFSTDGSFSYIPAANFTGPVTFTYQASDGASVSNTATVTITVQAAGGGGTAPVANDDPSFEASVGQTLIVPAASGVLGNDTDAENNPLTAQLVGAPASGTFALGTDGGFSYTPAANAADGSIVTFTYRASDGTSFSNTATATITVQATSGGGINHAPVAYDQQVVALQGTATNIALIGSDPDEGDVLGFQIINGPSHGTLSGTGASRVYTPAAGYTGPDSFTFAVNDGQATSAPAAVTLDVIPNVAGNHAPEAYDFGVVTSESTPVAVTLLGSDPDGDSNLTFPVISQPQHGTLTGTVPNLVYTPAAGYTGDDTLVYTVSDGLAESAPATVTILVTATQLPVFDLTVSITNNRAQVTRDTDVVYDIIASNLGTETITGAQLQAALSSTLTNAGWTCETGTFAVCPAVSSGTGPLNTMIDLPAGSALRFAVVATVTGPGDFVTHSVTVTLPSGMEDGNPANNSATDTDPIGADGIFKNGFEGP